MKKKIILLIQTLILLSILWLSFFLSVLFLQHNEEQDHFFPPKNAQLAICLNGEDLINKAAFSAFIESKDIEVSNKLRSLFKLRKTDVETEQKSIGLDLFTSIHFFTDEYKGEMITGLIVNIKNTSLWDKNSAAFFGSKSFVLRKESNALILSSPTLSKSKITAYYKSVSFEKNYEPPHESAFSLQLRYMADDANLKTIQNLNSNISVKDHSITSEGLIVLGNNVKVASLSHSLFPKNFHIDSRIISKEWNDTLKSWAKRYVAEIPSIKAISLNYGGLIIQSTQNGVLPLPNMELILEFEKEFSIQNFISKTEVRGDIDIHLKANYFKIGPKIYYLQQLTPTSIYIGTTKNPVILTKPINPVISFSGSPKYLTDVKGSRMMMALLNMNDEFSQLKQFCNVVETVEGTVRQTGNQPLRFVSSIHFPKSESAMNELLKVVLTNAEKSF